MSLGDHRPIPIALVRTGLQTEVRCLRCDGPLYPTYIRHRWHGWVHRPTGRKRGALMEPIIIRARRRGRSCWRLVPFPDYLDPNAPPHPLFQA